ncbi:pitrilysin family protein [Gemmobacter sp.]|uniref:M16 family metallopeptidase n=1 Tax=Gemmobacter sp. TaxID=1898957 RepID=UPI002AFF7D37|nr:pitrilysin family protein [Gemmobacter sp.]
MIRIETLPNGLRIATDPMPRLETAAIGLWVNVGARHEAEAENGIAHFLEHMAFKGTARRSALQIASEIEDVGGYLNAYTSNESTAYYARVLRADVPLALDVIADIVMNPAFEPREVEVERGVILQEIGQMLDTPDDVIFEWLQEAAFPGQPMGRSILGTSDRVSGFDASDLRRFVGRHYQPGQMVLAAAGAVDHDAIVAQARALFGGLVAQAPSSFAPARFAPGERRAIEDLEQVHLALAFQAEGWHSPDLHVAHTYAGIMGGGMSSRLFQKLREEHGMCYTVDAQSSAHEDVGLITVYAGTGEDQVGDLCRLTMDELKRAADDMTEAEVARARAQRRAGLLMGLEGPFARTQHMARMLALFGRIPDMPEMVAEIDAVTLERVKGYAAGLAERAQMAMAVYGPADDAPEAATLRERLAA